MGGTTTGVGYAPDNKRVFQRKEVSSGVFEERVMFYGPDGMRLGIYKLATVSGSLRMEKATESFYWGSKLVKQFDAVAVSYEDVVQDRLGSVLARGVTRFKYYPYGEERGSATADDREKFGTYWRDSYTGWDHADQRYYSGAWGRFASPDPYQASGGVTSPASWNRYSFVEDDPVNSTDPKGLLACSAMYSYEECMGGSTWGGEALNVCFELASSLGLAGLGYIQTISQCAPILQPGMPLLTALLAAEPTLTCQFDGLVQEGIQFGSADNKPPGYHAPVHLKFSGAGGNGTYTWGNTQSVKISGSVTYSDGFEVPDLGAAFGPIPDETLRDESGPGLKASFFDAPGVSFAIRRPNGNQATVQSANVTWDLTLRVTVSSGSQTVHCPVVQWRVNINIRTVRGRPVVSGGAQVIKR
jgi:RHS repeat-associated protein